MRFALLMLVAFVVVHGPARSESVPEALRRIDAKLQEVARSAIGERGPPGVVGPTGPRGPKGEPGASTDRDSLDDLSIAQGRLRLHTTNSGGVVQVNNTAGENRAFLATDVNDSGALRLFDSETRRRSQIASLSDGTPAHALRVNNEFGKEVAFIGEWSNTPTGGMFLNDKDGARVVSLGVRSNGEGFALISGESLRDYAEVLEISSREGIRPGSIVAYDSSTRGLVVASASNARRVIGVISGAGGLRPGMVIGSRADGSHDIPVAMSGVIYARVSAEGGAVEPGDLLIPSSVPGVGMRAEDPARAIGSVFGKALEPWSGAADEGLVLMLVMNR